MKDDRVGNIPNMDIHWLRCFVATKGETRKGQRDIHRLCFVALISGLVTILVYISESDRSDRVDDYGI